MTTVSHIQPHLERFKDWLVARGAEVFEPCAYELLRFKAGDKYHIIYYRQNGNVTFHGSSEKIWRFFRLNTDWRAMEATKRKPRPSNEITTIRKRDGDLCFYCQKYVPFGEEESSEHLVSLTHGGPHHISNKFLAHRVCNQQAGTLSAPEKIAIHTKAVVALAIANYERHQRFKNELQNANKE